eukprot:5619482-Prymnesium_polylepis.1
MRLAVCTNECSALSPCGACGLSTWRVRITSIGVVTNAAKPPATPPASAPWRGVSSVWCVRRSAHTLSASKSGSWIIANGRSSRSVGVSPL